MCLKPCVVSKKLFIRQYRKWNSCCGQSEARTSDQDKTLCWSRGSSGWQRVAAGTPAIVLRKVVVVVTHMGLTHSGHWLRIHGPDLGPHLAKYDLLDIGTVGSQQSFFIFSKLSLDIYFIRWKIARRSAFLSLTLILYICTLGMLPSIVSYVFFSCLWLLSSPKSKSKISNP